MRPVAGRAARNGEAQDVVPPIRFESGVADIPQSYIESLRKALDDLRDRRNVRLHLIGHADDQPLSDELARIYGDNAGLSRERAGEVAEFLQTRLALPADAISYEWAGDTQPIAINATTEGRALNRRVEVEVWYDETQGASLTEEEVLVREDFKQIKVCRMETSARCDSRKAMCAARVCRISFRRCTTTTRRRRSRKPSSTHVRQALENLRDKQNVVVKLIGYTDNVPLTERNARIYGNHLALSKARAHRVALALQEALDLPSRVFVSDGRGEHAGRAQRHRARARAEPPRRSPVLARRPAAGTARRASALPETRRQRSRDEGLRSALGQHRAAALEHGQPRRFPRATRSNCAARWTDIADKTNVRLRFIGYTANERLDRRTAAIYGDDVGLAAARARARWIRSAQEMDLAPSQAEHEGRGYVQSNDVVNAGFTQDDTSLVAVQVVYDEPAGSTTTKVSTSRQSRAS